MSCRLNYGTQYKLICFISLLCIFNHIATAKDFIIQNIPNAQKVGESRLSFLFWDVYDATLYAPNGNWSYNKPFALSLHYLLDIEGDDIADRSVEEMRGQGLRNEALLANWHGQMKRIFPDVRNGSVLSALFIPGQKTVFYENNRWIGTITGSGFTHWFSSIWLSERTSQPKLREELLSPP